MVSELPDVVNKRTRATTPPKIPTARRAAPASTNRPPRPSIVFVVYPGFQSLDLTGPFEVFNGVNQILRSSRTKPIEGAGAINSSRTLGRNDAALGYRLRVVAAAAGPVRSESGITINADAAISSVRGPIDTLVVCGGSAARDLAETDPVMIRHVVRLARSAHRIASVCSGAFVLGSAGLIDGRTVCTHWARANELRRRFPHTEVDGDSLYRRDGNVWTSAGVTAGVDLALAMAADDHGADIARTVASWLVMFYRRPGGQSQFAAPTVALTTDRDALRRAEGAVLVDPSGDHRLPAMAAAAAMSERNFHRVFVRELGVTPAKFVESVRVAAAAQALETTSSSVDVIAAAVGFRTAETMRRTFVRLKGIAPSDHRDRFALRRS
jgi:transcriptional regulator GlxA family with amidase domain